MAKQCKLFIDWLDTNTRYLANTWIVKDSPFLLFMLWKKKNLIDNNRQAISDITDRVWKFNNTLKKMVDKSVTGKSPLYEKYTTLERKLFNMLHDWYKVDKKTISYEQIISDWRTRFKEHMKNWLAKEMHQLLTDTKMIDNFVDNLFDTYEVFTKWNYNFKRLIRFLNTWDFFDSVFLKLSAGFRAELADSEELYNIERTIWWSSDYEEHIAKYILQKVKDEWIKLWESAQKRLVSDVLWKWMFSGSKIESITSFINEVRWLQAPLKYTNLQAGPMMLIQNTIVNTAKLISMKASQIISWNDPAVIKLLTEDNVLASEWRAISDISMETELWDTFVDWTLKKIFWEESKMRVILEWWLMWAYDVTVDSVIKKNSIARALSKLWVDPKRILDNSLSKEEMNSIRAWATTYYNEFFWNSQTRLLSRNRFSRWLPINAMQNYMFQMTWQATFAVNDFVREFIRTWHTWDDFMRLIDSPRHQEFKTLLTMSLITGKIAVYLDQVLNPDWADESRAKKVMNYMKWIHEYWQALWANFFWRIFESFWKSINQIEYMNDHWETVSLEDGANTIIYNWLNTMVNSLFREFNVFNIPSTMLNSYLNKWLSLEDTLDMWLIEYTKLSSWLNRFNLVPWFETFDLKHLKQSDDMLWTLLTSINETNESIRQSNFLKDMANIEDYLHSKWQEKWSTLFNTLAYLPILKSFWERWMTDMRYSKILQLTETDPFIQDLYNWKWNQDFIDTLDQKTLYSELTAFDLRNKKLDENLQHDLSNYWLTEMKWELFANMLADKMWDENLKAFINQYAPEVEKMNVAKILAFAESEVPGSWRVLLSYLSSQYVYNRTKQINEAKGLDKYNVWKSVNLSQEEEQQIKKEAINLFYPHMYIADKTSWFKLISQRFEQIDPKLFIPKGSKTMDNTLANALALTDMIAYQQAKDKIGSNAQYIKSVFSLIWKYIQDPIARTWMIFNSFETISWLHAPDDVKNNIKTWMLLWNIDFLKDLQKDDKFMAQNKWVFNNLMNILFWHLEKTNISWIDWMRVIDDDLNKKAAITTGNQYKNNQYTKWNYKALDDLKDKARSLYKPGSSWIYTPNNKNNSVRYPYNVDNKYKQFQPEQYHQFIKFYDEMSRPVATRALVHWYVNKTPEETRPKIAFTKWHVAPKFKTISHLKIPKKQFYYKMKNRNYD